MAEVDDTDDTTDSGIWSPPSYQKALEFETPFLIDYVDYDRISDELCEKQLLTTTELESLPTAVSQKERCRIVLEAVKPRINDNTFSIFLDILTDAGFNEAVDQLKATYERIDSGCGNSDETGTSTTNAMAENDKQTQLMATLRRYPEKWKSSLRFDEAFADILEQEGVPPAILAKVKDEPSDRRTAVFLDIVTDAELPYDAFQNTLENTGQSDLVYLLEEKPRSGQEKDHLDRCGKMAEHILKGTALKLWETEKPSSRIALPGVGAPVPEDWSAITNAQQSLVTITTGSKPLVTLLERYRSTSDPLEIYEDLERDMIVGKKLTMVTVAVFLGCCLKLTLTITQDDFKNVAVILRRMVLTFKRHIAYWFHHNGGWDAFALETKSGVDSCVQTFRRQRLLHSATTDGICFICFDCAFSTEAANAWERACMVLTPPVYDLRDVADMTDVADDSTTPPFLDSLQDAMLSSPSSVLFFLTYPRALGTKSRPPDPNLQAVESWFTDSLLPAMANHQEAKRRLAPVGIFGATDPDFSETLKNRDRIDIFPDYEKRGDDDVIASAAARMQSAYDRIIESGIEVELHGDSDTCILLELTVLFANASRMDDGLMKAHGIQIRTLIKNDLADPASQLRKSLLSDFDIGNIRVPLDEVEDVMIIEVVPYKPSTPGKILGGIGSGSLGKLFSGKVVFPQNTPAWSMAVSVDEGQVARVLENLKRQAVEEEEEEEWEDNDSVTDTPSQSVKGAVSAEAGRSGGRSPANAESGGVQAAKGGPRTRPAGSAAKSNAAKLRILGDLLRSMMQKEHYRPYDLLQQMEKYRGDVSLDKVKDNDGFNLLHLAVVSQVPNNLAVIFYLNLWGLLRERVVTAPHKTFSGLTPGALAEKLSGKPKGPQVTEEFDFIETRYFTMSDLSKACLGGKKQFVEGVLKRDTSGVTARDNSGSTPLFYASAGGHVVLMELLMKHGADATVVNERRETCLHVAASLGRAEAVGVLLRLGTLDTSASDNAKMRPVDYAADNGDLTTLNVFKKYREPLDDTLVSLATNRQRMSMVRYLVKECHLGVEGQDGTMRTPIHNAVIQGHMELLQFLVEQGANLSHRDKMGRNLLHHLAEHYKDDGKQDKIPKYITTLLKERGVFTNMVRAHDKFGGKELMMLVRGRDKGRRAWHYVEVKRRLVTQFKKKLASGFIDVLEFGSVRHSGFGMNPSQDVIDEIDRTVDKRLSILDKPDCTPLHLAVTTENKFLVKIFLDHGADANAKDHFGLTPLHLAAVKGNTVVARLLEEAGASLSCKDGEGKTPKDVAEENGHEMLFNFFQGRESFQLAKKFVDDVEENMKKLTVDVLEAKRAAGTDVRHHVVGVLRDIQIDINTSLLDLGVGPIMEESEPSDDKSGRFGAR